MKLVSKLILVVMLFTTFAMDAAVQDLHITPKREMRSAWVATVWNLDWPSSKVTIPGNEAQIQAQKNQLTRMLDSLKINNMNAINFQVRTMSDALYESSYEPWSNCLTGTRGVNPGYDPLAFAIEECHKRGMECHAWVNPYRYESQTGSWNGQAGDYRAEHPDWIMDNGNASILNPGKEEVIDFIVKICREIVTKYDVDGILYDDYFYLGGTPLSADADLYNAYTAAGGTLDQRDWRRDNVNRMIKGVYDMIQEEKPWVRFGVSPAGVACTDADVASSYGIVPSPGSDWQYNDIFSDPIAWISQKTVDFISPQIYWTIGNTTDYADIAPWWSMVADTFDRHFYSSHSITSLTSRSEAVKSIDPGMSQLEATLMNQTKASGPNNSNFDEYADQIMINRESSLDAAPGSIFYSAKYLYLIAPKFAHYLKTTVFSKPALLPVMTWKKGENPGLVKNLAKSGNTLSWSAYDNVRYTVYAVPTSVSDADFMQDIEYLLGVSYENEFEIPADKLSGYRYAVAVLDRMGNEYSAIFEGSSVGNLAAPAIVSPANGAQTTDPFVLKWSAVEGAAYYQVELSTSDDFKSNFRAIKTTETSITTVSIANMKDGDTLYWRVRCAATNYNDGVSATYSIIPQILEISSPANLSTDISVEPKITWVADGVSNYIVEISDDSTFESDDIIHSAESTTGEYQVPAYTLQSAKTYYARVRVTAMGREKFSEIISFTTEVLDVAVPTFAYPKQDGKFYSEDKITFVRQDGVVAYNLELASSPSFPRVKYVATLQNFAYQSIPGGEIKLSSKNLVEGTTYYIRATATYNTESSVAKTAYTDVVSFVYSGVGSGVEDNLVGESSVKVVGVIDPVLAITVANTANVYAEVYNAVGASQGVIYNGKASGNLELPLSELPKGIYIVAVNINGVTKTVKFIK